MKKGTLFTDGASKGNPGPSSIGLILKDEYNNPIVKHSEAIGHATNNTAEYTALLRGLQLAKKEGITHLDCFSDSELMVGHVNGKNKVSMPRLVTLMLDIKKQLQGFDEVNINHVRRHFNQEADSLANQAFRQNKSSEQILDSL